MREGRLAVGSWGLYDLANTIFSMNVISLYFPLFIAESFPRGEVWYAVAYSLSMLAVAIASPFAGSIGDRSGHKRILLVATILAVGCTAFLGRIEALSVLLLFALANFGYQVALVAYNSLITSVADPEDRGRVSGLGVALGYVGSFIGMFAALPFIDPAVFARLPPLLRRVVDTLSIEPVAGAASLVRANAFVPTAILFGLFALPLFFFVRERMSDVVEKSPLASVMATLREILRDRNLRNFYIATFLYMDAIHTVYIVMATFARFAMGLDDGQIVRGMSIALGAAVAGSFAYGFLTDRVSGRTALLTVLGNWVVVLVYAIFAQGYVGFVGLAMMAGVGLGGVEVVARVALLGLVGEKEKGRYFGFFNFTGRASSIVGPQLWALTLFAFEAAGAVRFRIGVGVMLLLVSLAIAFAVRIDFRARPAEPGVAA
jgi:MFS transporter, UMF1 family